ncbi:MAG: FG-GAP repeat protein [Xanthomonadales bacterium]|nr:FG-GAP repeat protein [Xanthomonadales bacterium]
MNHSGLLEWLMLFNLLTVAVDDRTTSAHSTKFENDAPQSTAVRSLVENLKLTPLDGLTNDGFGWSVSLGANRAVIGSYLDDHNATNSGSAYVFDFDGQNWSQTQKLMALDGASSDQFGSAVSLSGDRVVIGAHLNDDNGDDSGSVYVFDFDGVSWHQTQKLTANDAAAFDEFGHSLSLDVDRLIIGAPFDDDNGSNSGSSYVFEFDGMNWNQTQKLTATNGLGGDNFGYSISVFGDRALIGAFKDNDNGSNSGAAYVFDWNGTSWTEQQKLTAVDGAAFDLFGVALCLFGDRALIGASLDDDNGESSGSAYVFEFNGNNWQQTQKLTASDAAAFKEFGSSVSLSGDRAIIGAHLDDEIGTNAGSVYVYDFHGITWGESQKLAAHDVTAFDNFGQAVSVFADHVLIGVPGDDDNGSQSGSAYVYAIDLIFYDGFDGP